MTLAHAYLFNEELKKKHCLVCNNSKYEYYFNGYFSYEPCKCDDWNYFNRVSIDEENKTDLSNPLAYIKGPIKRPENIIESISFISWAENLHEYNIVMKDFLEYIIIALNHFEKISFCVCTENKINRVYKKWIDRFGLNLIGISQKHLLFKGELKDCYLYELIRNTETLNKLNQIKNKKK